MREPVTTTIIPLGRSQATIHTPSRFALERLWCTVYCRQQSTASPPAKSSNQLTNRSIVLDQNLRAEEEVDTRGGQVKKRWSGKEEVVRYRRGGEVQQRCRRHGQAHKSKSSTKEGMAVLGVT